MYLMPSEEGKGGFPRLPQIPDRRRCERKKKAKENKGKKDAPAPSMPLLLTAKNDKKHQKRKRAAKSNCLPS